MSRDARPRVAGRRKAGVIRRSAIPVQVYNEGLVVYVYDEANTPRLRDLLRKHRLKQDFFNNLQAKAFHRAVAKDSLCVAYTLEQDDPISVEVAVGKALSKAEMQVARWHEPQKTWLSLPSGRLRIDTPNTMPLDPDPPLDPGAIVQVKPGKYELTLYRVDWDEMRRAGIRRKMPGELILLTPIVSRPGRRRGARAANSILEFPLRQDTNWVQDFRIEEKQCKCKLYFYGYWEGFWVNMDQAAVKALGLQPGSRLRVETERLKFDALFLDKLSPQDYIACFGKQHVDRLTEAFKEFALASWERMEGRQMLQFIRYKGARAVSERHLDTWIGATVSALPEKWELPRPQKLNATVPAGRNAVKSVFVMVTDLDAVLNIRKSDLKEWNLSQGDQLSLTCNGETRTLVFCDHEKKTRWFHFITGNFPVQYYSTIERVIGLGGKIFAAKGTVLKKDLSVDRLPVEECVPVAGYFDVFGKGEPLLRIRPIPVDGDIMRAPEWIRELNPQPPWIAATPGASLELKKKRPR